MNTGKKRNLVSVSILGFAILLVVLVFGSLASSAELMFYINVVVKIALALGGIVAFVLVPLVCGHVIYGLLWKLVVTLCGSARYFRYDRLVGVLTAILLGYGIGKFTVWSLDTWVVGSSDNSMAHIWTGRLLFGSVAVVFYLMGYGNARKVLEGVN